MVRGINLAAVAGNITGCLSLFSRFFRISGYEQEVGDGHSLSKIESVRVVTLVPNGSRLVGNLLHPINERSNVGEGQCVRFKSTQEILLPHIQT